MIPVHSSTTKEIFICYGMFTTVEMNTYSSVKSNDTEKQKSEFKPPLNVRCIIKSGLTTAISSSCEPCALVRTHTVPFKYNTIPYIMQGHT